MVRFLKLTLRSVIVSRGIELTQFLANGDVPCEQSFLCGLAFSISEVICLAVSRVFG